MDVTLAASPAAAATNPFEEITRIVFETGFNPTVIAARWPAFRSAFHGFEHRVVARFGDDEIARLLANTAIVRNARKLRATVVNARAYGELEDEHGNVAAYLTGLDDSDETISRLERRFLYIGRVGVRELLARLRARR